MQEKDQEEAMLGEGCVNEPKWKSAEDRQKARKKLDRDIDAGQYAGEAKNVVSFDFDLPEDREITHSEVLGQLAGYASVCWEPKPEGEFDSTSAAKAVDRAVEFFKIEFDRKSVVHSCCEKASELDDVKEALRKRETVINALFPLLGRSVLFTRQLLDDPTLGDSPEFLRRSKEFRDDVEAVQRAATLAEYVSRGQNEPEKAAHRPWEILHEMGMDVTIEGELRPKDRVDMSLTIVTDDGEKVVIRASETERYEWAKDVLSLGAKFRKSSAGIVAYYPDGRNPSITIPAEMNPFAAPKHGPLCGWYDGKCQSPHCLKCGNLIGTQGCSVCENDG